MKIITSSPQHALIHFIARHYALRNWNVLSHLGLSRRAIRLIAGLSGLESNLLGVRLSPLVVWRLYFPNLYRYISQTQKSEASASACSQQFDTAGLWLSVFSHVVGLYYDNQREELHKWGLGLEEAECIRVLPATTVHLMSPNFWRFASLKADATTLERLVAEAVRQAYQISQFVLLVRAGAPRDMVARYYGVSRDWYTQARTMREREFRGRPHILSDDLQRKLYELFVRCYTTYIGPTEPMGDPSFFLDIYERLGRRTQLRDIWAMVQEWFETEGFQRQLKVKARTKAMFQEGLRHTPHMAPRVRRRSKISCPPARIAGSFSRPMSSARRSRWALAGIED